jgi:DhnA family fructose-bisphosphate aldolase class Ia
MCRPDVSTVLYRLLFMSKQALKVDLASGSLSLMGLDAVNLQVLSTAGSESEKKNAAKVLKLLDRGRHWVLVVLLLSNVIGKFVHQAEIDFKSPSSNTCNVVSIHFSQRSFAGLSL